MSLGGYESTLVSARVQIPDPDDGDTSMLIIERVQKFGGTVSVAGTHLVVYVSSVDLGFPSCSSTTRT